jgi:hypothetical protein
MTERGSKRKDKSTHGDGRRIGFWQDFTRKYRKQEINLGMTDISRGRVSRKET